MRVTLIHNPQAGEQGKDDARALVKLLNAAGHDVRYQSSKDDGWEEALHEPAEVVAVAGGDGTIGRVVKRMAGRGIPVAPLPSGTANNISRSLGVVERPFEELVRSWSEARRVKLDIGVAEGPWGRRYFVEGLGTGLFARLLASGEGKRLARRKSRTPEQKVDDALARLKTRAERATPVALEAFIDGEEIFGRYLLLEALNIPYVGANLFLAPDSQPGDGYLQVVLVTEAERERLVQYLKSWQENRERLAVLPSRQGQRLALKWTGFELHIDDKRWPKKGEKPAVPAAVEARLEGSVEILVPPDANGKQRA